MNISKESEKNKKKNLLTNSKIKYTEQINGITVYFPLPLYEIQRDFISSTISKNGSNIFSGIQ